MSLYHISGQQYQQSVKFPDTASEDDALTFPYIHDELNCANKPGSSKSFGKITTSRVGCEYDMNLPTLPFAESSNECGQHVQEETLFSEMNSETSTFYIDFDSQLPKESRKVDQIETGKSKLGIDLFDQTYV